jgi:aspartate-semialdehyde dehydrogenase
MSRSYDRQAKHAGGARVAVVGAGSPDGGRIREALSRARVPGAVVALYGATGGAAVLSEYADEARLIQELDLAEIALHDVVFLCERGESAAIVQQLDVSDRIVVDLVDALDPRGHIVVPDGANGPLPAEGRALAVPHELTVLLLEVLLPLERTLGVDEATAVVLRPAADFGDAGLEELREQTVRLLSFESVPRDVFGRQLAFNVLPLSDVENPAFGTEIRVAREMRDLLGWPTERLGLRVAVVPVFLGHAAQLRLRCRGAAADVRAALDARGVRSTRGGRAAPRTPLEASAEGATTVVDVSEDGHGGVWIWIVAGELAARRADLAVRAARAVIEW